MEPPQSAFPLSWPTGWKRATFRTSPRFGEHSIASCCEWIFSELQKLGARHCIISCNLQMRLDGLPYSNQKQPQDPGVAIYFELNKQRLVLGCDNWSKVEHNLWAVVKHIEALRGQKRWCVGSIEQAFSGYKAIPETTSGTIRHWREVFGIQPTSAVSKTQLENLYRQLAKQRHPDGGGTHEAFIELQTAWTNASKEVQL